MRDNKEWRETLLIFSPTTVIITVVSILVVTGVGMTLYSYKDNADVSTEAGIISSIVIGLPSLLFAYLQWRETQPPIKEKPPVSPSQYASCAHQDEAIARRLYEDLQEKGIQCWMASHDLRPGDYHHSRIDEAINLHEKVVLLLSEHAVNSSWVKHEVQIALAREVKQDCTILFPFTVN